MLSRGGPIVSRTLAFLSCFTLAGAVSLALATPVFSPFQEARADDAAPVASPQDVSLTAKKLVERGMPAPDRGWGGADYKKAAQVLDELARSEPAGLPRFQSTRSGQVFSRIVSRELLDQLASSKIPVNTRMGDFLDSFDGSRAIFSAYVVAHAKGAPLSAEVTQLASHLVRLTRTAMEVSKEFLASLPADDPKKETRQAGLTKMKSGLATMLGGVLTMLTERSRYAVGDRVGMAVTLKEVLPHVYKALPELSRAELSKRLDEIVEGSDEASIKKPLEEARASLRKDDR